MRAADDFPPTRTGLAVAALAAAVLAVATYANTFGHQLTFDDASVVAANPAVQRGDWRTVFTTASWGVREVTTPAWRPLATLSLSLTNAAPGSPPRLQHVTNVVAHAITAALVVLLAASAALSAAAAAVAGLLFAAHPANSEAVAHVAGRAEVLGALFAVGALLAQRRAAVGGVAWIPVAIASAALALLAHEQALALVVLMPLADLVIADRGSVRLFLGRLPGRRGVLYAGVALVAVAWMMIRQSIVGADVPIPYWENPAASAPGALRVLTALHMMALAAGLLVVPRRLSADYSYRQLPVVTDVTEPAALVALGVAAVLLVVAVVLWRRRSLALFWLALTGAALAVVSSLFGPADSIFRERWLYLPAVGVAGLVASALAALPAGGLRAGGLVLGVVLAGAGSVQAAYRALDWYNDERLARVTATTAPDSASAHRMLGLAHVNAGDRQAAVEEFARALAIAPNDVVSLYQSAAIFQRAQQDIQALTLYRRAVDVDPTFIAGWLGLARTNLGSGRYAPSISNAERVIEIRPDLPHGHIAKGFALDALGRKEEARAAFEQAVKVAPTFPEALVALGSFGLREGDPALAAGAFERLVAVAPTPDAYQALVLSYRNAGRGEDADRTAAAARQRYPDDPSFAQ